MDEVIEQTTSDSPEQQQPTRPKPIGRPKWEPTAEDRLKISRMASLGIPYYQIAIIFGVGVKKLRGACRTELSQAAIYANLQVTETLHKMATSGTNTAASIFWAKTRCGFRTGLPALSDTGAPQPSSLLLRRHLQQSKLLPHPCRPIASFSQTPKGSASVSYAKRRASRTPHHLSQTMSTRGV